MLTITEAERRQSGRETDTQLTVVIPVFNESACLFAFHRRLQASMEGLGRWRAMYVDDGSDDCTRLVLRKLLYDHANISVIRLSRNFGKEVAVTAGLDHADGDAVIVIDADLQDPPEVIPALVAEWRRGFDMVYAQRRARAGDGWLKRVTASLFYRLMERLGRVRLPRNVGDFRLLSRRAVDAVRQYREHHRFMKGLFASIGFASTAVPYDRTPRYSGRSKWTYWRLWNLALEGITGFTVMPLKIATYLGMMVAVFSLIYGGQIVLRTVIFGNSVPGYPSLMTVVLFMGGVQLMTMGVIGEYLGRVFNEAKFRPLYIVEDVFDYDVLADPVTDKTVLELERSAAAA
ncbi:MAG: glycosyltransferase family 2 protein [Rhodospirillales bacterium]|nr:glycosyltransferase family 2 protein [Rhodospirillales bacterium]